jgi:alkylmercury lyase
MTTTNTTNTTTADLARRLREWDGLGWVSENGRLMAAAIIELAAGEPVDPARLAERAGRPLAEVLDFLHSSPAEWDDRGRLVGFGLTLRPTRHRFTTAGRTLYTWCAPDALAFPVLTGSPALVESTCFATGTPVTVEVARDGVRAVDPATAFVSIVPRDVGVAELRERLCHEQHFFASGEAALTWRQDREDVLLVPVADAFEPLRWMMRRWAGEESEAA